MYYVEREPFQGRFVEATCVDVSTDWVPLFDIKIKDSNARGRIVETINGVRGYTALQELVQSRGWEPTTAELIQVDTAAEEGRERPE
jgi:hypothetical protein